MQAYVREKAEERPDQAVILQHLVDHIAGYGHDYIRSKDQANRPRQASEAGSDEDTQLRSRSAVEPYHLITAETGHVQIAIPRAERQGVRSIETVQTREDAEGGSRIPVELQHFIVAAADN